MRLALSAAAAMLLAGSAGIAVAQPARPTPGPLPESVTSNLPRNARPLHYRIDVRPDAQKMTFSGTAAITLVVYQPTSTLTLNANELAIVSASLVPADGKGAPVNLAAKIDAQAEQVQFTAPKPILPGTYRLDVAYTGKINTQANGLFALDYPDKRTGKTVRALFTQFEAPDGRRFAPEFDEPAYKATFELSAVVPANQMAVSNTPVAREMPEGAGFKHVYFQPTPRMSSYLLFFATGDFERLAKPAPGGVEAGIVSPAGSGEQARFALDSLAPLLGYYGDYFQQKFPLPKLDNVAGPGQSQFFGAMENWGAIFTFERALLTDPAITSAARKQQIYNTQAHETAHQWFGDLVTMAWWDDIWLNEGFASWMQTKATDRFHPEWFPLLGRVGGREDAMALDSFKTTHPIVQHMRSVEEINQAFDSITYRKGEAVISMLEAFAGEEVWRNGIRSYIAAHKYANAKTDDLWQAVEAAGAPGLIAIAHDFTTQPGIPLVRAEATCAGGQTALSLTQGEFSRDRKDEVAANPRHWRVPLLVEADAAAPIRTVLEGSASLNVPGCGAVIVNGGQLGYFRTLYSPAMLAKLQAAMPQLQPIDQLGLVRDNLALASAGYQPGAPAIDLLAAIPADANPVVAQSTVSMWGGLYDQLQTDGDRAALAATVRRLWLPRLQALGFDPRPDEQLVDATLRAELISVFGKMGDPSVVEQARSRFAKLASDSRALDGPLKTTWLNIAAKNASPADWQLLSELAGTTKSATERSAYYELLGAARDRALAQKALDFALTGKAGTTSAAIITSVAGSNPDLAYDFTVAHRAQVEALVDDSGKSQFYRRLVGTSMDPAMVGKLEQLRGALPEDQRKPIDQAIAALKERLESYPRMGTALHDWLAAHPAGATAGVGERG
uniref:M1 family metallopeptidase n=1 Tax=Altererythrobacter segetis TaxID=1104773 RepID=UPI00140A680A|nr:M1 family metallopeptidase [Altererythrobacter segetis]